MVTILEPRLDPQTRLDPEAEPVSLPDDVRPRTGYLEMRYAVPFAGVRYYSFRPRHTVTAKYVKPADAEPVQLSAQLIDERVILL